MSASRFSPEHHPRAPDGRFSTAGASITRAVPIGAGERRSLTRGEAWQRLGNKISAIPASYTGSTQRERPVGSFTHLQVRQQIPAAGVPAHMGRFRRFVQMAQGAREEIMADAEKHRAGKKHVFLKASEPASGGKERWRMKPDKYPEGTAPATLKRAYNHAALLAMHDHGLVDYDFKMDDALKAELKPVEPFILYVRRRLNEKASTTFPGQKAEYLQEFGQTRMKRKNGEDTGVIATRFRPNQQMIKAIPMDRTANGALAKQYDETKHKRDKSGRFASVAAGVVGATAGSVLAPAGAAAGFYAGHDALSYARGRPLAGAQPMRDMDRAHTWRSGAGAQRAQSAVGENHADFMARTAASAKGSPEDEHLAHSLDDLTSRRVGAESAPTTLYRGVHGRDADLWVKHAKNGGQFRQNGYLSFTGDKSVSRYFTDYSHHYAYGGEKPSAFKMMFGGDHAKNDPDGAAKYETGSRGAALFNHNGKNVPDHVTKAIVHLTGHDKPDVNVASIDHWDDGAQNEFMVGRGAKFRVHKHEIIDGVHHIHAEVMGHDRVGAWRSGVLRRAVNPAGAAVRMFANGPSRARGVARFALSAAGIYGGWRAGRALEERLNGKQGGKTSSLVKFDENPTRIAPLAKAAAPKPLLAAGLMISTAEDEPRVLLLKRGKHGSQPGTWCFPGGKIELGETARQAAIRETAEEIGFEPVGRPVALTKRIADGVDFTTFHGIVGSPFDPVLNDEHTDWRWARPDDLPSPMHPGCAVALAALQKPLAKGASAAGIKMARRAGASLLRRSAKIGGWAVAHPKTALAIGAGLEIHHQVQAAKQRRVARDLAAIGLPPANGAYV